MKWLLMDYLVINTVSCAVLDDRAGRQGHGLCLHSICQRRVGCHLHWFKNHTAKIREEELFLGLRARGGVHRGVGRARAGVVVLRDNQQEFTGTVR